MGEVKRLVCDVLPSAWWDNAEVAVLECGHRHVRPKGSTPSRGSVFACCFCEEVQHDSHPASLECDETRGLEQSD